MENNKDLKSLEYKLIEEEKEIGKLVEEIKDMQNKIKDLAEYNLAGKMDVTNEIIKLTERLSEVHSAVDEIKNRIREIKGKNPKL